MWQPGKRSLVATRHLKVGELLDHRFAYEVPEESQPDAVVHYGEQPSAPYSMQDRSQAVLTERNNVVGDLNLLFGMQRHCTDAHLVKLGTLGEYGTPNTYIEEGYIHILHVADNLDTNTILPQIAWRWN